ncbi:NUDIX domain-containing protein [Candidatus Kaiserbacteria bacterium]|nr:NUDIX domain-containing protein [Candidatus Kaiserbacteria bacterium]
MAHIHEKIDFTISVMVVDNGKVFLHKHKKRGIWLPPGGHIELDEDPNQAALREVKEEVGFDVDLVGGSRLPFTFTNGTQDLVPPMFLNRHRISETHEHVDLLYFARCVGGELVPEEEGIEMRWFTEDEIKVNAEGIHEDVQVYALAALKHFRDNL